jgi:hypothetical protein
VGRHTHARDKHAHTLTQAHTHTHIHTHTHVHTHTHAHAHAHAHAHTRTLRMLMGLAGSFTSALTGMLKYWYLCSCAFGTCRNTSAGGTGAASHSRYLRSPSSPAVRWTRRAPHARACNGRAACVRAAHAARASACALGGNTTAHTHTQQPQPQPRTRVRTHTTHTHTHTHTPVKGDALALVRVKEPALPDLLSARREHRGTEVHVDRLPVGCARARGSATADVPRSCGATEEAAQPWLMPAPRRDAASHALHRAARRCTALHCWP